MQRGVGAVIVLGFALGCQGKAPYEGKSVAQLEKMLRSGDAAVQSQGAFGLGRHGPAASAAVPALSEALRSPAAHVRQNSALALGLIGPEATGGVDGLIAVLGDHEWAVRRQAALSLGQIGVAGPTVEAALAKGTKDPHHLVQQAARDSLAKLKKK